MDCHLLLQGIFPTQGLNLGLQHYRQVLYRLSHEGSLPAMQKTLVRFLGWEDTLEKEVATHSNIRAWKIPGTEEPGGLQSMGVSRVGHD